MGLLAGWRVCWRGVWLGLCEFLSPLWFGGGGCANCFGIGLERFMKRGIL